MNSAYLNNERSIPLHLPLAHAFGVNQAIILQQIRFWMSHYEITETKKPKEKRQHFHEGRWWVYNTYEQWQADNFGFWSTRTIQRYITDLEERGVLISGEFNKNSGDRTKWYTIDFEEMDKIVAETLDDTPTPPGQDDETPISTTCPDHLDKLSCSNKDTESTYIDHPIEELSNDNSLNIDAQSVETPSRRASDEKPMPPDDPPTSNKFEVGQTVYVWSDVFRKQIECTVIRETEKQVRVRSSVKRAFQTQKGKFVEEFSRGKANVSAEPKQFDTLADYPPQTQEILHHVWGVKDGEGIPGQTAQKANTIMSMLKNRYAPVGTVPDAEELNDVFEWAKKQDPYFAKGKYKDFDKITDFVRQYRLEFGEDNSTSFTPPPYDDFDNVMVPAPPCPVGKVDAAGYPIDR
jgi:hypothetical protein